MSISEAVTRVQPTSILTPWQLSLLQEYQHQQELQTERARLTQLQIEAAVVQHAEVQAAMLQPPKQKKRRLQTSQKRLLKVVLPVCLPTYPTPAAPRLDQTSSIV